MLTDKFKKTRMHSGIKSCSCWIWTARSIMKIQFLKERWIFFPRLKKWRTLYFHHQQFLQIRKGLCGKGKPDGNYRRCFAFLYFQPGNRFLSSGELSRTDRFCMGTRSLVAELEQNGIRVVTKPEDSASVVLIGFDTENTSERYVTPASCSGVRLLILQPIRILSVRSASATSRIAAP